MTHHEGQPSAAGILGRMQALIAREFEIGLDTGDPCHMASFALYGLKSTQPELRALAEALLGLKPELTVVRSLTGAVDRVRTGFAPDAPVFVAMRARNAGPVTEVEVEAG